MERKILSGIIALLAVIGIIFISGCVQKECESDVDCLAKTCFTVECMNNKCAYSTTTNCCSNEICEIGETYPDCAADCPNCDDNNNCTVDSYDYHERKCLNAPILDAACCGNGACQIGETYSSCARDCPNCDDGNACTKDSYDYHEQKCVNKIITPCCGNGICDKDAETHTDCTTDCPNCDDGNACTKDSYDYHEQKCVNEPIIPCCGNGICDKDAEMHLNCSIDCPNCDDRNKLTTDSFDYTSQTCESVLTHYFIDDFEAGLANWKLTGKKGEPVARSTSMEGNTTVLRIGAGVYQTMLEGKEWGDYIFKVKFKIISSGTHFGNSYRFSTKSGLSRYMVFVSENRVELDKTTPATPHTITELDEKNIQITKNSWHTLEIRGYGNILNVYVDDELAIKHKDTENPILSGGVAFNTFDESEFLLDDVEIIIITGKDVIYP